MPKIYRVNVSFGDCDPAGIVFYPNMFRWMDAAFQNMLRPLGGHNKICCQLHAVGVGLVKASAQFRHPARDMDLLEVRLLVEGFSNKTITLMYGGYVGDTLIFEGNEVRCLFVKAEQSVIAGDISSLREILETYDE